MKWFPKSSTLTSCSREHENLKIGSSKNLDDYVIISLKCEEKYKFVSHHTIQKKKEKLQSETNK